MIRRSVAAAALTLATVAPSFAAGYESRAVPPYGDFSSRVVVDSYAGRESYVDAADHCATRRHVIGWTSYSRRIVRSAKHYDY